MPRRYRACLVGCGRMGATIDDEVRGHPNSHLWLPYSHAAACAACERTELAAVSDVLPEKAEAIRDRYGAARAYTDYREMIEREQPEILCVATRPATHAAITRFAAEHGVWGIYCEKPLCCSLAEADAMVEAVEMYGVRFNYGAQRRYMPLYRRVRALCDTGELGAAHCVLLQFGAGAALWSLTHAADVLLFLARDGEVELVQGTASFSDADWEGERLKVDPAIASGYVRFTNGVQGYLTAGAGTELEVCAANGKARMLNDGALAELRLASGPGGLLEPALFPETPAVSGTLAGILDLAEALDAGRETMGPIRVARRGLEIVLGILESHRQGGARVTLPLPSRTLSVSPDGW